MLLDKKEKSFLKHILRLEGHGTQNNGEKTPNEVEECEKMCGPKLFGYILMLPIL